MNENESFDSVPEVDYAEACMDEIALEGLDGITASALWIRLSHRPNFRMSLDDASRSFLWETVVHHPQLDFYLLPDPRLPLVIHNRFANVDAETGCVFATPEESTIDDIYPYSLVTDTGVWGSCSTYHKRERVTDEIRPNQVRFMSLSDADKMWGESLVLVASTERRRRALMGPETNPNLQLLPVQYAMLERVGRARYLGEVSVGQSVIHSNAKTLFYHRKVLINNNLIAKQVHHHYLKRGSQSLLRNGMLFHLTRFYVERKSKIFLLYQELVKHLLTKPDRSDTVQSVQELLGVRHKSFKKAFRKGLTRFAKIVQEPFRLWHPDSNPDQWYYINKSEKMESVIRLLDDIDQDSVQRIFNEEAEAEASAKSASKGGDNDDDDDEDDGDADGQSNTTQIFGIPDQSKHILDRSVLHQAYDAFVRAGTEGLSERSLATVLGVPRLEGRSVCRKLLRIKALTAIMRDRGRQKFKNYSAKCFSGTSEHSKEIIDECQKLLEFASDAQSKREEEEKQTVKEDEPTNEKGNMVATKTKTKAAKALSATSTPSPSEIPSTFLDDVRKMSESGNSISLANSGLVTSRAMKRANLIVKLVREARLFDSPFMLQKVITKEEAQEGYRIDRKSLARLINRLNAANLIKSVKSVLRFAGHEKKVHFICDPSLKSTDPLVYSALENAKLKYFSRYRVQQQTLEKLSHLDPIKRSATELRNLTVRERNSRGDPVPVNGRIYGFEPKFVRMKLLHQYMFYLVYDYGGRLIEPTDDDYPAELREFSDRLLTTMPPVYHAENSWKRFLPCLPQHSGWKPGWCLYSDILLRMPLSLLIKLLNVNYKVEGLREYLDHPILRHMPITHLPSNLRAAVLYARRYVYRIYDIACQLGYMGILSCNQPHKEKDQAFFFLHRNARILDTTISMPGYVKVTPDLEYPIHVYSFDSSVDVTQFWETFETICLHTPLGLHPRVDNEPITFDIDLEKKPGIAAVMMSRTDNDIVDDGTQPGDGLGAAGLDSAFFAHLKRNWSWVSTAKELKFPTGVKRTATGEPKRQPSLIAKFLHTEENVPPNPRKRLARLAINNQLLSLTAEKSKPVKRRLEPDLRNPTDSVEMSPKRQSRTRKRKLRSRAIRRPYYDAKDMAALKLMTRFRVTWSAKEDSLLLLTKVACFLLDPEATRKRIVVPFGIIRDFLHKHVEESKSKTSRACQRRLRYMMLNPETAFNVSVFVGESKDDPVIREICDQPYVKLTNEAEWTSRFAIVIERLLVKFKSSASTNKPELFQLPDSLQELEAQYNVILSHELLEKKPTFTDVKNIVDIHFGVVYSLILSSIGSSNDGDNWNHLLYQIYQQYPESLLRSVFAKLRSKLIVSRRKNATRRLPKKTSLCLVTFPYQLSITFHNLFLSTHKENVFMGAYELMSCLVNDSLDTSSAGVDFGIGCSLGGAAAIVSLIHGQKAQFIVEIPDNMIVLNVDDARINERGRQFLQKFCDWEAKRLGKNRQGLSAGKRPALCNEEESSESTPNKKSKMDETQPAAAAVTENIEPSTSTMMAVDDNCDSKETLIKMNSSSRFALYLLRTQLNERILSDTQHSQDYLAVNACQVICKLHPDPIFDNLLLRKNSNLMGKLKRFVEPETTVDEVADFYLTAGLGDEAVREMRYLYVFLQNKRELGAKMTDLEEAFKYMLKALDLKHHLELMQDHNLVLRVGLNTVRYVAAAKSKPWLLHSFKPTNKSIKMMKAMKTAAEATTSTATTSEENPDETASRQISGGGKKSPNTRYVEPKNPDYIRHMEPFQCLCRPWRRPNGELNRPILNDMLRSILSHVMCFPAVPFTSLCDKYASVLSLVQLVELLEVLEDAGCVRRSFLKECQAPSLFGPSNTVVIVDSDEDGAAVYYHPTIDCIVKLGRVLFSV